LPGSKECGDEITEPSTRSTEEAEGKALSALVTEPQRARMDSAAKKETPASIPVPNAPSVIMVGSRREYLAADNLKIDITVKLSSAMDVYQGFEVNDRAKFNVAIIYEDGAAGKAFLRSGDSGARRRMRL